MIDLPSIQHEPTPVDDVRRVRERLSREAGGDIAKLAEHANRLTEQLRGKLRLKFVEPPAPTHKNGPAAG